MIINLSHDCKKRTAFYDWHDIDSFWRVTPEVRKRVFENVDLGKVKYETIRGRQMFGEAEKDRILSELKKCHAKLAAEDYERKLAQMAHVFG